MVSIEWFRSVHTEGDFPEGATPELLFDLYDFLMKFGDEDPKIKIRRLSVTSPREINCCVVTEEMVSIALSVDPGGISRKHMSHIILADPASSYVAWDGRISVEDIVAMIAEVDAEMRNRPGAFDPETGARMRFPYKTAKTKMEVDRIFDLRGKVVLIPIGADPEEARHCFDKPDEVMILTMQDGRPALCRKADEAYLLKRTEIVVQLLKIHHGIQDGDMSGLSAIQQALILDKAHKLLAKMEN
ncbi:hypothetical protein ACFLZO_00690 [Patescibacteria group bacterium]